MKPGTLPIIVGSALFLAALVALFVVPLVMVLSVILGDPEQEEVRFTAPGVVSTTAKEAGRYYLWNEYRTIYDGKNYDRSENIPDGMEIRIETADGDPLEFVGDGSISSSTTSRSKNSIGYVEVRNPGELTIEVSGGDESRVLSFSRFKGWRIIGAVLGGVGIALALALGGIGIMTWGLVKLSRARRTLLSAAAGDIGVRP